MAPKETAKPTCPRCGSPHVIPIVYGYPIGELQEQASRGEVRLGGCGVYGNDPAWYCTTCERPIPPDGGHRQVLDPPDSGD